LEPRDGTNRTPLHAAAEKGHPEVMESLLARGADKEARDSLGRTPLLIGVDRGCPETVQCLLARGADPNVKDSYSWTPLHLAAMHRLGNFKDAIVVGCLIAHGADPEVRDKWDQSPLDTAASRGNVPVIEALLAGGARKDAVSADGTSALRRAATLNEPEAVKCLLDHGATGDLAQVHASVLSRIAPIIGPAPIPSPREYECFKLLSSALEEVQRKAIRSWLSVPPGEFAARAMKGPVRCEVAISGLPGVAAALSKAFSEAGVGSEGILELFDHGLLAICPKCNKWCGGKALLLLQAFGETKDHVVFTGDSGGAERLIEGVCRDPSCSSRIYELFWCPDLDPMVLEEIRLRGVNIDPSSQRQRDPFWKPRP
jgi:hypothetical protein